MAAAYPEPIDAVVPDRRLAKSEAFVKKVMEQTSFLGRHLCTPGGRDRSLRKEPLGSCEAKRPLAPIPMTRWR
jgi:butyrate kinase